MNAQKLLNWLYSYNGIGSVKFLDMWENNRTALQQETGLTEKQLLAGGKKLGLFREFRKDL